MKFFAVFAAVLAIAAAAPAGHTTQWTLHDLSQAIQNPTTPAELLPYIEHALNIMMEQLFAGQHADTIAVPTPAGLLPVEAVLGASPAGVMPVGVVDAPTGHTTQWTLHDLSEAIQNPATPAELLPYIEHALNIMMEQLFNGHHVDSIAVPTPAGLLPVEAVLGASPAAVMPVGVVDAPIVEPTPAVISDASGSPLVQIIVNIKSQQVAETPAAIEPSPVLIPEPVIVAPAPAPIEVLPAPAPIEVLPAPAPIEVLPAPAPIEILPAPAPIEVVPAPAPIEIAPVPENPIDIIAIGTPDVNPIDLLQPVPVVVAGADGERV